MAFSQIIQNKFFRKGNDALVVAVPLTPQHVWFNVFKKVLVLDATAHFYPYIYKEFHLTEDKRDYSGIKSIQYYHNHVSKTAMLTHPNVFIDEDMDVLDRFIFMAGSNPLIVTFKQFEEQIKLRGFSEGQTVAHYGGTRGSNRFRSCDAAVLLGAYRLPVDFHQSIKKVYPEFDPVDFSLMTWHQELFRTRIRNRRSGATLGASTPGLKGQIGSGWQNEINTILVGDKEVTESFISLVRAKSPSTGISPIVAHLSNPRDLLQKKLADEQSLAKRYIYQKLYEDRSVSLREVANRFRNGNIRKAFSVLSAIKSELPSFWPYLRIDHQYTLSLRNEPGDPVDLEELKSRYAK